MLEGQVYTVYLVFLMHDITGHPSANGVVNDSPCVLLALMCTALLKKVLRQTPSKRYTMDQIKSHVWCRK